MIRNSIFTPVVIAVATLLLLPSNARLSEKAISGDVLKHGKPLSVILDTDMWGDIDDALALAMIHTLQDRGEANLLAVTISTEDKWCAPYVSLINTFYGDPQIPIGIVRNGFSAAAFYEKNSGTVSYPTGLYPQLLSERKNSDGTFVYPRRLTDGAQAMEAVALLRKTLAAQPDGGVVMIQVGFSTNLARLLESSADDASALEGRELVRKKVRLLSAMAGNFAELHHKGNMIAKGTPEFNLMMDVSSAQKLFSMWPTPIVTSGFEVGLAMLYPAISIEHDYSYVRDHPIAETYRAFHLRVVTKADGKEHETVLKWPRDHATFDLTSVLYAIRPDRGYFSLSEPGKITVLPNGSTRFDETQDGQHRYLIVKEEQKARTLEAMVMLASQPPRSPPSQ